jgi:hypothetical protein
MTEDRIALEKRLAYDAKLDAADAQYHRNMRKGQDDFLQLRIEEPEARNSDFSRANEQHIANKLAGETKTRDLQNSVNFYQGRLFGYRKHADAEINKLEKERDALTKKNSALDAEMLAKNALISKLHEENGTLNKKISDRGTTIKSKDVLISKLEKESVVREQSHDISTAWIENDKKRIAGLNEQVRALHEELAQAKETIAASKASPSPAAPLTPSMAQTGRSPSPSSQSTDQQRDGSYPSPPMSSSQGSSVSDGASTPAGNRSLSDGPGAIEESANTSPTISNEQMDPYGYYDDMTFAKGKYGSHNDPNDPVVPFIIDVSDNEDSEPDRGDYMEDLYVWQENTRQARNRLLGWSVKREGPASYYSYRSDPKDCDPHNFDLLPHVEQTPDNDPTPGKTFADPSTGGAIDTPAVLSRDDPSGVPAMPADEGDDESDSEQVNEDSDDGVGEDESIPAPAPATSKVVTMPFTLGGHALTKDVLDSPVDAPNAGPGPKFIEQDSDDLNNGLREERRRKSGIPKAPKAMLHGSGKRTGANGAIRKKKADSNTATPKGPAGDRPLRKPRQPSEEYRIYGAHEREQQASADRSANSGNASPRGNSQARRGGRSQGQTTRSGVGLPAENAYANSREQNEQKRDARDRRVSGGNE